MKTIRRGFVFQLIPKGADIHKMKKFCGCCRFVYNKLLEIQKERYKNKEKHLSYYDTCKILTELKKKHWWLKEAPIHALQQSLKDLDRGYQNFYAKRANAPRFHKKGVKDRFRYPDGFKVEEQNKRVFLPKIGWVRYRRSRFITGNPKNITVKHKAGKWFICIQTEEEIDQPVPQATSAVGIDVGIAHLATLSDGTVYESINCLRKQLENLAKIQRSISRKQKFSKNWKKAVFKLQKLYVRIADTRKDYLHKITTEISNNHAVVFVEDLQIANMTKSAKGTVEEPGKNVRAKSGLNLSIHDQKWGAFRQMLEYKLDRLGGELIAVPPQNTSRTCPQCGHISKENRKTQAKFCCVACGFAANADLVGAINIERAGHARLACDMSGVVKPLSAGTLREDLSVQLC